MVASICQPYYKYVPAPLHGHTLTVLKLMFVGCIEFMPCLLINMMDSPTTASDILAQLKQFTEGMVSFHWDVDMVKLVSLHKPYIPP